MSERQLPVQVSVTVPAGGEREYTYVTDGEEFINLVEFGCPNGAYGDVEGSVKLIPDGEGSAVQLPRIPDDGDGDPVADSSLSEPERFRFPVGTSTQVARFTLLVPLDGEVRLGFKNTTAGALDVYGRVAAAGTVNTALGKKSD